MIYEFNRLNKQESDYICISECSKAGALVLTIISQGIYVPSLASSKRKSERFGAIQIIVKLIDHGHMREGLVPINGCS